MSSYSGLRTRALAMLLAMVLPLGALAERHDRMATLSPAYLQECAACHVAYPPSLLPAASWKRILGNLAQHYGTDASLDTATAQTLVAWITPLAASGRRTGEEPPEDRITRSPWFIRQHDEVSPTTWKRPAVKSAANCSACHPGAPQGDFNEHRVRIPR